MSSALSQHDSADETLSGPRAAATLLLTMDKSTADRVIQHFDDAEIRALAKAAASLKHVAPEGLDGLLRTLTSALDTPKRQDVTHETVEQLISGSLPKEKTDEILAEVTGDAGRVVWSRLARMKTESVARFLAHEHPQVTAACLTRIDPNRAAEILQAMPKDMVAELAQRMLGADRANAAAMRILEQTIFEQFSIIEAEIDPTASCLRLASVVNNLERDQMEEVLASLERFRPADAQRIRGMVFTFEDLVYLEGADLAALVGDFDSELLVLALREAADDLTAAVLAALSPRARRLVEQELAVQTGRIDQEAVKNARKSVARRALQLSGEGTISLPNDTADSDASAQDQ